MSASPASARGVSSLVGPMVFAAGVWAAAGHLTLETTDTGVRLALPASPWWFVAAVVTGGLLSPLRARPLLALPSLLSVLPWLPIPVPAVVLLWTGRAAWLPVALVIVSAAVAAFEGRGGVALPPRRTAVIAGVLTLVVLAAVAMHLRPRLPAGDEPHYLMITQSLLRDGDLRIENNHERGDMEPYLSREIRPHYLRTGVDGAVYSIHAPGVPVIVLPAMAASGYRGAQVTVVVLAALAGGLIWGAAWLATGSSAAAWFAWAAVAGSVTFLVQGVTIFPDGPGAFFVAGALAGLWWLERRPAQARGALLIASLALSVLPWLHSRFVVISCGLALVAIFCLVRHPTILTARCRLRLAGVFLVAPALCALAWFAFFYVLYGTPNPSAPYGRNPEVSVGYIPGGFAGLLFDQQFGLLVVTPVLAMFVAGLAGGRAPTRRVLLWGPVATAAAYLAASAMYWMWWAGVPAPPARLTTAILPVMGPPLAIAYARAASGARHVMVVLLCVSLGIAAVMIGADRGALLWNVRDGHALVFAWLHTSVDLARAWPSFFWGLVPGDTSSQTLFWRHVAGWCAVSVSAGAVFGSAARRWPRARDVSSLVIPVTLMLAVQIGWFITGSSRVDAATAQMTLLAAPVERVLRISPGSFETVERGNSAMAVRVFDARQRVAPASLLLPPAAPGSYIVEVAMRRPQSGSVVVRERDTAVPLTTSVLDARSRHVFTVDVPENSGALVIECDAGLRDLVTSIDMRPVAAGIP